MARVAHIRLCCPTCSGEAIVHIPRGERLLGLFTPGNLLAMGLLLFGVAITLSLVVPYRVVNSAYTCRYCSGYTFASARYYAGIRITHDSVFVHTEGSRLYEKLVAPQHTHEWVLTGECEGVGNLIDNSEVTITKGEGAGLAEQVERSLIALKEGAELATIDH